MNRIEKVFDELRRLTDNQLILDGIGELQTVISEERANDIALHVPIGDVDEKSIDSSEYNYCEQYDVGLYYEDSTGESFQYDEWEEHMSEKEELRDELEGQKDELESDIEDAEDALEDAEDEDEQYALSQEIESLKEQLKAKTEAFEEVDEYISENRDRDSTHEEIYWNTVWNFRGYVNEELARRLHFGVMTFTEDAVGVESGEQFMFLQGCGQDLSPKIVAYQALEFGYVDPKYAGKFEEPGYFLDVVGEKVFKEVCGRLGISHLVREAERQSTERMERFERRLSRIQDMRNATGDQALAGILALSLHVKGENERPSNR